MPSVLSTSSSRVFGLWLVFLICCFGGVPESSAKDYWDPGLKKHNELRAHHSSPQLELDHQMSAEALMCAEYYLSKDKIDHSCKEKGNDTGENLFWSSDNSLEGVAAVTLATKEWYDEVKDYDFSKNSAKDGKGFSDIGHFTQLVWKDSKKLGLGYAKGNGKEGVYVVALYKPPGNYPSARTCRANVPPPSAGRTTSACLPLFIMALGFNAAGGF